MRTAFFAALLAFGLSTTSSVQAADFALSSPDIGPAAPIGQAHVFNGFGCSGDNISPALSWDGVPDGTKSLALTVYDPDAPTGSGWWHWVVYNLPATTTALPQGAGDAAGAHLPAGTVQGHTDFGSVGYGGPCPPQGDTPHHYIFTLHALSVDKLELPADATAALVGFAINGNRIAATTLTALYGR
jgi:Raf kinase inhibitor-like YbhB/YbcL family protein